MTPTSLCFNYIIRHHIGEIPTFHLQHYDSFPSVEANNVAFIVPL